MSQYQNKYWSFLREIKTHVIYLHTYAASSEKFDKRINIFLALTSSASIAGWAIWQQYSIVWAVLIATSQVLTASKPYLPFKKRLDCITELNDIIQEISLECEHRWFDVSEGNLSDREIHDLYISLKEKSQKAENRVLKNCLLPKNEKFLKAAETEADIYLKNTYF